MRWGRIPGSVVSYCWIFTERDTDSNNLKLCEQNAHTESTTGSDLLRKVTNVLLNKRCTSRMVQRRKAPGVTKGD